MIIREVTLADIDALYGLARRLNTVNLQPDRDLLSRQIALSERSFRGEVAREEAEYLFLLEYEGEIAGTSLIIAQHGTFNRPAVYFRVRDDQKYSTMLGRHFKHQVLDLSFDYDGPTEIGGLIVNPDIRRRASYGFGKPLSFVRFLYIAIHREQFRDEIVAELLPQLREDGRSDLWDALGKRFCGIEYEEADRISRHDIEFIRSLFPMFPIYTSLLPEKARDQIGIVGRPSRPAKSLLTRIGFQWDSSIDPFDGGPTYRVRTEHCDAIRRTSEVPFLGTFVEEENDREDENSYVFTALFAKKSDAKVPFRAAYGSYTQTHEGVRVSKASADALELSPGDLLHFMPLSGLNLVTL